MIKTLKSIVILLFLFVMPSVFAADVPVSSAGELNFVVDKAVFNSAGKGYCEFCFQVFTDQLGVKEEKYAYKLNVTVYSNEDKAVVQKSWETESAEITDSIIPGQLFIPDVCGLYLESGTYQLDVMIQDANSEKKGRVQSSFSVPSFETGKISASQLEFISKVTDHVPNTLFVKNQRVLIPNVERRYGILNPLLTFYYELYNLDNLTTDSLKITYQVLSQDNNIIKQFPDKNIALPGRSAAILHALSVADVKTGVYTLAVSVADNENNLTITLQRQFEVVQLDYLQERPVLSQEDAEIQGNLLTYLASPEQVSIYERLDLKGKGQFLINFWLEHDPDRETAENEFLKEIQKRYHYANTRFSWAGKEGWKMDRGRILIKYGFPDEQERYYNEADTKPYEKWIYNKDRRFDFVFADLNGTGRFDLIHSTKEGEVKNNAWQSLLHSF